jgi:hypothetical protein
MPMAGVWSNRHVLETPEEIDRLQNCSTAVPLGRALT